MLMRYCYLVPFNFTLKKVIAAKSRKRREFYGTGKNFRR